MIIRCPNCDTAYNLDKEAISNGGRKVRCKRCSHVFWARAVDGPGGEATVEIFYKEPYNPPSKLQRAATDRPIRGTTIGHIGDQLMPSVGESLEGGREVDDTRGEPTAIGIGSVKNRDASINSALQKGAARPKQPTSLGFSFAGTGLSSVETKDENVVPSVTENHNPTVRSNQPRPSAQKIAPRPQSPSTRPVPISPLGSNEKKNSPGASISLGAPKPLFGASNSSNSSNTNPSGTASSSLRNSNMGGKLEKRGGIDISNDKSFRFSQPFDVDSFLSTLKAEDFKSSFAAPLVTDDSLEQLNKKVVRTGVAMPLSASDHRVGQRLKMLIAKRTGAQKVAAAADDVMPNFSLDDNVASPKITPEQKYVPEPKPDLKIDPPQPSGFAPLPPTSAPTPPSSPTPPTEAPAKPAPPSLGPPSTRGAAPSFGEEPAPKSGPQSANRPTIAPSRPNVGPPTSMSSNPAPAPAPAASPMLDFGVERATGAPLRPGVQDPFATEQPPISTGVMEADTVEMARQNEQPGFARKPAPFDLQSPPLGNAPDKFVDPVPPTEIVDARHALPEPEKKKSNALLGIIIFILVFAVVAGISYYVVVNFL